MTRAEIAAELAREHPVKLADGRTLRLRLEPDDSDPFDDSDCYGAVVWARPHPDRIGDGQRPTGFDGAAEKLHLREGAIWWQPPADVKRTDEGFGKLRSLVRDLIDYGTSIVVVEVCKGQDAYRRPIVVNVASLGGIEPDPGEYLAEVVTELLDELGIGDEGVAA